jgi:hypothetical protein
LLSLPGQKIPPDLPVQLQQFGVALERGLLLSGVDTGLEVGQSVAVPVRRIDKSGHSA